MNVTLEQAWSWACPMCHAQNFEKSVVAELNQEERTEMRIHHGIEHIETGDWVRQPEHVQCRYCTVTFTTSEF